MNFTHLQTATSASDWENAGLVKLSPLSPEVLTAAGGLVVLAAHPDDEALGCIALCTAAKLWGVPVTVVLFTAGENSHPYSPTWTADQLKQVRSAEFCAAMAKLNPHANVRHIGLPDGQLTAHGAAISRAIKEVIKESAGRVVIAAPFHDDGHPDHDALGAAALHIGKQQRATVLEYPIWYWTWAAVTDRRWKTWRMFPDPQGTNRREVWDCYSSQVLPLSDQSGDEAILQAETLEHFDRSADIFAVTDFALNSADNADEIFDALHKRSADPWSLQSSAYEKAKRQQILTSLPRTDFSHCLEIGCSIGSLSRELARVSQRVTALDASRTALQRAQRLNSHPNVWFTQATVPYTWPPGLFDLVVLSETGFYLSPHQLEQTLIKIDRSTGPEFTLVLCHWAGDIDGWPLTAREVHEQTLGFWPSATRIAHKTAAYTLDVITIAKPQTG
jgi:LmbE family N-acetylglucosaminyl deacetylase